MKLTKQHLFLILLLAVIFCCGLGVFGVVEGMQNKQDIKVGSIVLITVGKNKHIGTVTYVNENGTYNVVSYVGKDYNNIKNENITIATDDDISKYIKEMRNTNNNRNNRNNRNNDYTPQLGISGNEYTSYTPVEGSDGLVRVVSTDDGRVVYATPQNTVNGIPGRSIPPGQEDLYILKSQVIPPVCPACPTIINKCTGKEKCPPCPPCGRCPEPSFECVKRPTYKPDNPYLPLPVLSDFSSFGM
jgi:hypothetical protein